MSSFFSSLSARHVTSRTSCMILVICSMLLNVGLLVVSTYSHYTPCLTNYTSTVLMIMHIVPSFHSQNMDYINLKDFLFLLPWSSFYWHFFISIFVKYHLLITWKEFFFIFHFSFFIRYTIVYQSIDRCIYPVLTLVPYYCTYFNLICKYRHRRR